MYVFSQPGSPQLITYSNLITYFDVITYSDVITWFGNSVNNIVGIVVVVPEIFREIYLVWRHSLDTVIMNSDQPQEPFQFLPIFFIYHKIHLHKYIFQDPNWFAKLFSLRSSKFCNKED